MLMNQWTKVKAYFSNKNKIPIITLPRTLYTYYGRQSITSIFRIRDSCQVIMVVYIIITFTHNIDCIISIIRSVDNNYNITFTEVVLSLNIIKLNLIKPKFTQTSALTELTERHLTTFRISVPASTITPTVV